MADKKRSIGSTWKACVKSKTGRRAVWRAAGCLEESMYQGLLLIIGANVSTSTHGDKIP